AQELAARKAAEAAQKRAAFLAEAGTVLSQSLEYEHVLSRLARLVVQSLADWCEFDMVENGTIQGRAGTHVDPPKAALREELMRHYPLKWDSTLIQAESLRSGKTMVMAEVSDDWLLQHSFGEEHRRMLRELGVDTRLVVPLRARGRVLGVLALSSAA